MPEAPGARSLPATDGRPSAAPVGGVAERDAPAAPPTLVCWGVRGSIPVPGPRTARWGGNTPCAELRTADGRRLVLDAGTGIRPLGEAIVAAPHGVSTGASPATSPTVDVLLTHAHADHVQGLAFFAPLRHPAGRVTLHVAEPVLAPVTDAVRLHLLPPVFPAPEDALPAALAFAPLAPDAAHAVGGFTVRPVEVAHPGGAYGFRITDPASARTLAFLPDDELAAVEGVCGGRRALLEAIAGSALLVHDAMYLPAELGAKRGWGHSSYAESIRLAADAGVPRLLLFHHHPDRDDDALDRLAQTASAIGKAHGVEVGVAREGEVVEV